MNARSAAVLLVLLVALGGGALLVHRQEQAQRPAAADLLGQPLLKGLAASAIAAIAIHEPGSTLTLQRRDDQWTLAERAGFPADLDQVRRLVLAALELKVGGSEPLNDKDRARLGLDGKGAQIEFRDARGKALAKLVVGRKYFKREPENPDQAPGDGRFVQLPEDPGTAYIVADPLALATAKSASWIAKTGFGAEKLRSMEVDMPGVSKWRIERSGDNADWKLTPLYAGEKLDAIRANSASYSLNRVELSDVAAPALRAEDSGLDKPVTVVASTFEGLTYTLKIGKPHGDDYYAMLWITGEPKAAGADATERARRLAERLPREKALAGQVLLIARSKFEDVLRKRPELLEKKDSARK